MSALLFGVVETMPEQDHCPSMRPQLISLISNNEHLLLLASSHPMLRLAGRRDSRRA